MNRVRKRKKLNSIQHFMYYIRAVFFLPNFHPNTLHSSFQTYFHPNAINASSQPNFDRITINSVFLFNFPSG